MGYQDETSSLQQSYSSPGFDMNLSIEDYQNQQYYNNSYDMYTSERGIQDNSLMPMPGDGYEWANGSSEMYNSYPAYEVPIEAPQFIPQELSYQPYLNEFHSSYSVEYPYSVQGKSVIAFY